jgi:hypothetical protein
MLTIERDTWNDFPGHQSGGWCVIESTPSGDTILCFFDSEREAAEYIEWLENAEAGELPFWAGGTCDDCDEPSDVLYATEHGAKLCPGCHPDRPTPNRPGSHPDPTQTPVSGEDGDEYGDPADIPF